MSDFKLNLTLQRRMRGLIFFSVIILVTAALFGLWQVMNFNRENREIQRSSLLLQENLQKNFRATKLLASVHSNLRLYMQSADLDVLENIKKDIKKLENHTPGSVSSGLERLQEIIKILAIRMNSLRENDDQIPMAEYAISSVLLHLQQNLPEKTFGEIYQTCSNVMIQYRKIYVSSIISGQITQIKSAQEKISQLLVDIESKLALISEKLPDDQKDKIKRLKDSFYWLDEAGTTVAAIRLTTLKTEIEIVSAIDRLKNDIAENSLERNSDSFQLIQDGLRIARHDILFLVGSLMSLALIFIITSFLISKIMITPLVGFVTMLRNLERMMTRQRVSNEVEDASLKQLSSFVYNRNDEIGEVARAIKDMLANMQAISFFRHTIEADETTGEICRRLANVFKDRLGLNTFIIYEKSKGLESMEHVFCNPPELAGELPEFTIGNTCRAKRTGVLL